VTPHRRHSRSRRSSTDAVNRVPRRGTPAPGDRPLGSLRSARTRLRGAAGRRARPIDGYTASGIRMHLHSFKSVEQGRGPVALNSGTHQHPRHSEIPVHSPISHPRISMLHCTHPPPHPRKISQKHSTHRYTHDNTHFTPTLHPFYTHVAPVGNFSVPRKCM